MSKPIICVACNTPITPSQQKSGYYEDATFGALYGLQVKGPLHVRVSECPERQAIQGKRPSRFTAHRKS